MYNFVIAVASKNRPDGATFNIIRKEHIFIQLYIYVHKDQYDQYYQAQKDIAQIVILPELQMTISAIRKFMQYHQYTLNHNMLMLDDDIECFERFLQRTGTSSFLEYVPFSLVCEAINKESLRNIDILALPRWRAERKNVYEKNPDYMPVFVKFIYISKYAYNKGLQYDIEDRCEDASFSILAYINDLITIHFLMFRVHPVENENNLSLFNYEYRVITNLQLYLKYGTCICGITLNPIAVGVTLSALGMNAYIRNGLTYSKKLNRLLEHIRDNNIISAGAQYLHSINWKSHGPYYEDIINEK